MQVVRKILSISFNIGLLSWGILLLVIIVPLLINQLDAILDLVNVWKPIRTFAITLGICGFFSFLCFLFGNIVIIKNKNSPNTHFFGKSNANDFTDAAVSMLKGTPSDGKLFIARLENYRYWSVALVLLLTVLGTVSIVSALIAATFTDVLKDSIWLKVMTLTSALSATLLTSLNLQGRASSVWSAYRHLESAVLSYGDDQDLPKLVDAYKEAEDKVGFVQFNIDKK